MRSSPGRLAAACLLRDDSSSCSSRACQASRTDCSPEPGCARAGLGLRRGDRAARQRLSRGEGPEPADDVAVAARTRRRGRRASSPSTSPATSGAAFSHSDPGDQPHARRRGIQACGYGDAVRREHRARAGVAAGGHGRRGSRPPATARTSSTRPGRRSASAPRAAAGATAGSQDFGVSNPDPIATPLASLAPTPSTTAPTAAVPLASPLVAPAPAPVLAAAAPGRRRARRRDHGAAPVAHAARARRASAGTSPARCRG